MNNMTYKIKENAKNVWIRDNENTQDLSPLTDANSVYFNSGRTLEQELGKGVMVSNVATVDSTMSKVIDEAYDGVYESCVFKGKTKWIDNDTQEILDDFVNGRNLSLIDCKMPVLRTVGKNLLNMKDYSLRFATTFVGSTDNSITFTTTKGWGGLLYDFYLKPNQTYHVSFDSPQSTSEIRGFVRLLNTSSSTIGGSKSYSFTTDSTGSVRFTIETPDAIEKATVSNIQIEEGDIKTPYEPYKSNILSTSEEIILREVGGVRDSYDALTGEYVQRIGEREYQEGDLDNSSVVADLAKTQYILDKPVTTIVEPSTIPFIYQNGHIILESGYEGQSLLPTLEYTAMTNRTGQVENVAKTIRRHETQLTLLEKMLIGNIIELDYNNTLMALNLKMDEVK